MSCRGIWVRKGSHSFGISLIPAENVSMLSVAWCVVDRGVDSTSSNDDSTLFCGSDTILQPNADERWIPNGTPVEVDAHQYCIYEVFIDPVGGKAQVEISIDDQKIKTFNCESKAFPTIAGEFRLTTKRS